MTYFIYMIVGLLVSANCLLGKPTCSSDDADALCDTQVITMDDGVAENMTVQLLQTNAHHGGDEAMMISPDGEASLMEIKAHTASHQRMQARGTEPIKYTYYKFTPTKMRGELSTDAASICELSLFKKNEKLDLQKLKLKIENPSGDNGKGEGAEMAIDGHLNTKWVDFNKGGLLLSFPKAVEVDYFTFTTSDDHPDRDPVQWEFRGSNTLENWLLLNDQTTPFSIPETRKTETRKFAAFATSAVVPNGEVALEDGSF